MKSVNALKVRTKFGQVMDDLHQAQEPVLLQRGKTIEAVLIPYKLFKERFVDMLAESELNELIERLTLLQAKPKGKGSITVDLRELRGALR